jgi:hypothetical protein
MALMLLVDRQVAAETVREDFQRLVSESANNEGDEQPNSRWIVQQDLEDLA